MGIELGAHLTKIRNPAIDAKAAPAEVVADAKAEQAEPVAEAHAPGFLLGLVAEAAKKADEAPTDAPVVDAPKVDNGPKLEAFKVPEIGARPAATAIENPAEIVEAARAALEASEGEASAAALARGVGAPVVSVVEAEPAPVDPVTARLAKDREAEAKANAKPIAPRPARKPVRPAPASAKALEPK